ncbi:Uncharacterised protein [Helicobacter canis]|uniref:Uncharacterized protein n=1 Tax=Helicobacter canis TaxID=29419 RepID=A0A377J612_9HELI|nr:Uncharacterised protein [Helicobacter canis]
MFDKKAQRLSRKRKDFSKETSANAERYPLFSKETSLRSFSKETSLRSFSKETSLRSF